MDTVDKLARYCRSQQIEDIKIIGAPKTIDNDLMEIDHCPGFASAAKYIATTFAELERDVAVYDPSESPLWKSWDATPDAHRRLVPIQGKRQPRA